MDQLDKFILDHRASFDEQEPSVGHFTRFEQKLLRETGKTFFSRSLALKVAAGIVVLVTLSVFALDFSRIRKQGKDALSGESGMTLELRDAMEYYDNVTATQMGTISKLACCGQDVNKIREDARGEISALDADAAGLKESLDRNPNDERLQSALLQNQQMKEKVLGNMISQLKNIKNK